MKSRSMTIKMKPTEQYFSAMLLTFESVDETLKCDHPSRSLTSDVPRMS